MREELLQERKKAIYGLICDELYVPMKAKEIAAVLNVPKSDRRDLTEVLDGIGFSDMVDELYEAVKRTLNYSPIVLFDLVDRLTETVVRVWKENSVAEQTIAEFEQGVQLLRDFNYE